MIAEIDIMIAEADSKRSGMGMAAVKALLVYVHTQMGSLLEEYALANESPSSSPAPAVLKGLMVKIQESNVGSRSLFEKLGFRQEGSVNYFGELKMVMDLDQLVGQSWWAQASEDWTQVAYGEVA